MENDAINKEELTSLLVNYGKGDPEALQKIFPLVYQELRKLATRYMARENSGHTLQATALVHEAFFKLVDQNSVQWKNRLHFYGIAAQMMRRILIDHARSKSANKRGGKEGKVAFDELFHWKPDESEEFLALNAALDQLAALNERQAKIVELRYFAGLSIEETADALDTSPATVKRDWNLARAYLARAVKKESDSEVGN